jgi:hypothetical protein
MLSAMSNWNFGLFQIRSSIGVDHALIALQEFVVENFFMLALFTCVIKKGIEMHAAERPKFPSTELFIAKCDLEFNSLASLLNSQCSSVLRGWGWRVLTSNPTHGSEVSNSGR